MTYIQARLNIINKAENLKIGNLELLDNLVELRKKYKLKDLTKLMNYNMSSLSQLCNWHILLDWIRLDKALETTKNLLSPLDNKEKET